MTKTEREKLCKALDHLENNPIEWEDAMALLYPLAGFGYRDLRKICDGDSAVVIGGVMVPNNQVQAGTEAGEACCSGSPGTQG